MQQPEPKLNRASCSSLPDRLWASLCLFGFQANSSLYLFCMVLLIASGAGCASQKYLIHRDTPYNPLTTQLQLASHKGPQVSDRTQSLLRRYALLDLYKENTTECLEQLQILTETEPSGELVYAVAELAYIAGKRAEKDKNHELALDMHGIAVSNAYMYLFASEFDPIRNPYDPQFRGACDLYNESLASLLKIVNSKGELHPGRSYRIKSGNTTHEVETVVRGNLRGEDFERMEFVNEFDVSKLDRSGVTYGLGVPLIAVRKRQSADDPREKYYPDGLSFPVTALLRVVGPGNPAPRGVAHRHHCVLEFHDALGSSDIPLAHRLVPLQTDLSTALAYVLDSKQFQEKNQANAGLFDPNHSQKDRGIYMLEPFDPNRIPVLMVHGLWSSPITWMPMFNDLRSFSELRKNYQFWFYHYPSGQPFWMSATQLRGDLAELRDRLDPDKRYPALDQMVLVGHSMGGLVSRMQTLESGQEYWRILSDKPFEEVKGKPEDVAKLSQELFFHPNPSIRRVVTIGTPHRGSAYSNNTTRWLGKQFIKLPTMMISTGQSLVRENPGVFRTTELLTTNTAIDSLSPESPVFPAMLRSPRAPWVTYHNIIGVVSNKGFFGKSDRRTDGVVDFDSAHMDDVVSEIVVPAEHQSIHHNPRAILEVRRILLEHLDHLRSQTKVAEQLYGPEQRISNQQGIPAVQISTGGNGKAASASPESDTPWLEKRLGMQNSYAGIPLSRSQSKMEELVAGSSGPVTPKSKTKFIPWLRTPLEQSSSRKISDGGPSRTKP